MGELVDTFQRIVIVTTHGGYSSVWGFHILGPIFKKMSRFMKNSGSYDSD